MSLTQRQKAYIKKHFPGKTAQKIAEKLKADLQDVEAFIESEGLRMDPARKRLFIAIAISLPFLFLLLLEAGLRLGNYKGDTDLFIDIKIYEQEFLRPNPNFTARYFFYTQTLPSPARDLFLKNKPENGFRVFMMGGSSAAAYPYGYNALPSRTVKDALEDVMPDRHVEVVNVATSAINTYTLYDQVGEILDHQPDLILIYSGHNEYYGALGVGSNEQLGSFPGFVRMYLTLQRMKTFLLLRDSVAAMARWFAEHSGSDGVNRTGTLMERIVREQSIPLDSELYELGKQQFESNLRAITKKFSRRDIPVMIGSLASNLKDHEPFISADGDDSAISVYRDGLQAYLNEEYDESFETLQRARDLDLLKFRAPTEFNDIIRRVADETPAIYVPVKEKMREKSQGGIIGGELMLEHLHPNSDGYLLMGLSFVEALSGQQFFGAAAQPENLQTAESYKSRRVLSDFDERIAYHRIRTLKEGWPFQMQGVAESYRQSYNHTGKPDSLAFELVHGSLDWERAKVLLGEHYRGQDEPNRALLEFYGLIRNLPNNDSPYVFAARVFLDRNDFDNAYPLLESAYQINPNEAFTNKMLGAIEVDRRNLDRGIMLLERSLELAPNDAQALYNLSGAYALQQDFEKAVEVSDKLMNVNPNFPGARGWRNQLNEIMNR